MKGSPYRLEGGVAQVDLVSLRAAGGDLSTLESLAGEPSCRVVLLAGIAGSWEGWPAPGQAAAIAALGLPVVAWVDGACAGEGMELALACDIRIASPGATFRMAQVQSGFLPDDGGTQRLLRAAGRATALWMLLTGDEMDAAAALKSGIVQRIGTTEECLSACQQVASAAPTATSYAREAVIEGADMPLGQGLRLEADLSILLQSTEDRAEGLRSFKERTPPRYEGR